MKTEHIIYNRLFASCDNYWYNFDKLKTFPRIVFSKNIFSINELSIPETAISSLKKIFDYVVRYKEKILKHENELSNFEKNTYKIRMKNNLYTVLIDNNGELCPLFENRHIDNFNVEEIKKEIDNVISDNKNSLFLEKLFDNDEYLSFMSFVKEYENIDIRIDIKKYIGRIKNGIRFKMDICDRRVFDEELATNMEDFIEKKEQCEFIIQDFIKSYRILLNLVERINNCKNKFWKASFSFDYNGYPTVEIDQKYFESVKYLTLEKIRFEEFYKLKEENIVTSLESGMKKVLGNIQKCGYRVMEVGD